MSCDWAIGSSAGARTARGRFFLLVLAFGVTLWPPAGGLGDDAPVPAETAPAAADDPPGDIDLHMKGADVRDVLATLAGSRGFNLVVAPDVSGEVTVNLHGLDLDEALRAILAVNGLTYVRRGQVIYVTREGSTTLRGRAWRETATFRLSYADPGDLARAIAPSLSEDGQSMAYGPTRTLVVQDAPEAIDRVRQVVRALDVAPRQVLIGARVLEVRLDNESSLGVDWASIFSAGEATVDLSTSGFSLTPESGSRGVFATIGSRDVTAFLDALREVVDFEALSAPQVLVLEGKEAEIIVGGKLGFYITTTTQTSTIQSVEFLDIGSLLTLTPTISDDGHIQMKIHPKVSDGVVENGLPSETTTEVTTQVLVADGETLFIGGLIRRRAEDSHSGVPLLGQIPYLGSLFGRRGDTTQRTEVVVLITPRIVKPGDPRATQPLELDPPQP